MCAALQLDRDDRGSGGDWYRVGLCLGQSGAGRQAPEKKGF